MSFSSTWKWTHTNKHTHTHTWRHSLSLSLATICFTLQERFLNELHILVKKKQTFKLTVDQGWFSEQEKKDELSWSQQDAQSKLFTSNTQVRFLYLDISYYIHTSMDLTRSKINGAKSRCLQMAETHVRRRHLHLSMRIFPHKFSEKHLTHTWADIFKQTSETLVSLLLLPPRRNNAYDGVQEFWIIVKERARSTEESSYEELQHQVSKADTDVDTKKDKLHSWSWQAAAAPTCQFDKKFEGLSGNSARTQKEQQSTAEITQHDKYMQDWGSKQNLFWVWNRRKSVWAYNSGFIFTAFCFCQDARV